MITVMILRDKIFTCTFALLSASYSLLGIRHILYVTVMVLVVKLFQCLCCWRIRRCTAGLRWLRCGTPTGRS